MCLMSIASKLSGLLLALSLGGSAEAWGDITTTPHRLVRRGVLDDTSDICVFCHTPSIGGGNPPATPLWQRSLGNVHTYTMYDDIGRLNYGDKPSVGSQSIACLSCHDANQAFSVTKLSLDHPFGVPYRGFLKGQGVRGQPGRSVPREETEGSKSAKQLVSLEDFREPSQGVVDNRTVWWVSATGNSALRTRGDLPLYLRRDMNDQDVPFIECSSCHDPHSSNRLFLRVTNEGSRLCLTCHDK